MRSKNQKVKELNSLNVVFSRREFENLLIDKGNMTWREYILNKMGQDWQEYEEIKKENPQIVKKKRGFIE